MIPEQEIRIGIYVLFVFTQSFYVVVNLVLARFYILPRNIVEDTRPETYRDVTVLIPIYREREELLLETLDNLRTISYPTDRIDVYVVYEADDEVVRGYIEDITLPDLSVDTVPVREDTDAWQRVVETADGRSETIPANKARALMYAFYRLDLDGVLTVLDADTLFPPGLFEAGVAGLETYDVVQAKQTVRNTGNGWLPFLEAMGMAAWTHIVYARTTTGPYQLLGKGYFLHADRIREIGGWDLYTATEDMSLGVDLYKHGCTLGVLDYYLQDLCPTDFDTWVAQKKRWVSGPYDVLLDPELDDPERLRFAMSTLVNQMTSVVNIVGIPAGVIFVVLSLTNRAMPLSPPLTVIVTANGVGWLYYTLQSYQAAHRATTTETWGERLKFDLLSNMVTQTVYATIWTIPIALAVRDYLQNRGITFEVTPK